MKEVIEGLFEIKNFLSKEDLSTVTEAVVGSRCRSSPFAEIVQRTAEKKVEGIHGEAKSFLVRYEEENDTCFVVLNLKSGKQARYKLQERQALHHDLYRKPLRTWTVILYLKSPDSGGELVFPFYNGDGDFTSNEISKTCLELASKNNTHHCTNTEYLSLMTNNIKDYLHFEPTVNTAYAHNTLNPNLWHYVTPSHGERISLIAFWEKEKR